jgi:hypothetical protein
MGQEGVGAVVWLCGVGGWDRRELMQWFGCVEYRWMGQEGGGVVVWLCGVGGWDRREVVHWFGCVE